MSRTTINGLCSFRFFRCDNIAVGTLHDFLGQVLETYLEQGDSTMFIHLSRSQFEDLAQSYADLCVGYMHPRIDSLQYNYRVNDRVLMRIAQHFPAWRCEAMRSVHTCPSPNEKKPK